MKKIFYIVSLLSLTLFGCSSDEEQDDIIIPEVQPTLLKKAVSGSSVFEYSYNGNKISEIKFGGDKITYSYSGDLITNTKTYSSGRSEPIFEVKYTYNTNQNLSQEVLFSYDNGIAEKRVYTYNSNGTISYQEYTGTFASQNTEGKWGLIYYDTAGRVEKLEVYNGVDLFTTTTYTYDAKNNTYRNVLNFDKLISNFESGKNNNILTSITYDANDNIIRQYRNVYTYNSDDFPIALNSYLNGSTIASATDFFY